MARLSPGPYVSFPKLLTSKLRCPLGKSAELSRLLLDGAVEKNTVRRCSLCERSTETRTVVVTGIWDLGQIRRLGEERLRVQIHGRACGLEERVFEVDDGHLGLARQGRVHITAG
jgi:hypothetical protein